TMVVCATTPCYPAQADGRYELFQNDAIKSLELYTPMGEVASRYQYTLLGDTLRLLPLSSRRERAGWITMQRASAGWCAANIDCTQQNLLPGPCAGEYFCDTSKSICNYTC